MANLNLGIIVGATTSPTVGRVFQSLDAQAKQLGRSLQQMRIGSVATEEMARYSSQLERVNRLRTLRDRRQELGSQIFKTGLGAIGSAYALASPIKESMQFESVMADVRKVVDMTDSELNILGKSILNMSTTMPMAAEGIGAIVAAAGQSGIAKNELLGFTKSAVKMGVAFDMTGEQAGEMMASFRAGMAISQPEVEALADAINYLDSNMNASAKSISEVVQRQGAVAKAAGLTSIQTAALSAALLNSGTAPEIAATALKNLTNALTKGGSATKAQNRVFEQLGLTSTQVTKRMQKDAEGTIKNVFARLAKMPAEMRGAMIGDLFGEEAKGAIAPLLVNVKALDDAFNSVADSTKYAGSMQKEYEIRSKTTANNAQLLSNKFDSLKIHVGSALLPALNEAFGVIGNMTTKIGSFAEKFPQVTEAIVGVSIGLVGLKLAALATAWTGTIFQSGWTMAVSGGIKAIAAAQWVWNGALAFGLGPIALIGAAIVGTVYLIYRYWEPISGYFKEKFTQISETAKFWKTEFTEIFNIIGTSVRYMWESLTNWLADKFAWLGTAINKLKSVANQVGSIYKSITKTTSEAEIGAGVKATMADFTKYRKGSIGENLKKTLPMPTSTTPLPALPGAKAPVMISQPISNVFHITQKAGEDSNALAERVAKHIERIQAKTKRGALHD